MTRSDSNCGRCGLKFSFFRSARRCRCCGGSFCPQCSDCAAPVELVQSLSRAAGPLRDDAEAAAMAENAYLQEASAKTARVCQSCFDSLFVYIVVDVPAQDNGGCQPGAPVASTPRARRFRSRCECLRVIERTCGPVNVAAALTGLLPVVQPRASDALPWRRVPFLVVHTSDINVVFAQCPAGGVAERRALFDVLLQCAVSELERTMNPLPDAAISASSSISFVRGGVITSPLFARAASGVGRFPSPWCGAPTGSVAGAAAVAPRCGRVPDTVIHALTMDAGGLYADCHFIAGHVTDAFRRVAPVPPPVELLTEPTATAPAQPSRGATTGASQASPQGATGAAAPGASGSYDPGTTVSPTMSLPSMSWTDVAAGGAGPHGTHGRRGICTLFAVYAPPAAVFLPPHRSPTEVAAAAAGPAWRFRWIQPGVYTDRELKNIVAELSSAVCDADAGLASDDPHRGVAFVGAFRVDTGRVASYLDDVRVATVLADYDELRARVGAASVGGDVAAARAAAAAAQGSGEPLRQAVREVAAKTLYKHGLECIASAKASTFASTSEFIERCASALLASDDLLLDVSAPNATPSPSATVERVFARVAKMQRAPPQQAVQPLPLRFLRYSFPPTTSGNATSSREGEGQRDGAPLVEVLSGAFQIVRLLSCAPDPAVGPYVILSSAGELVAYDAPDVTTMRRLAAAGGREVLLRIHNATLVACAPRVFLLHDPQFPQESALRRAHAGLANVRERDAAEGRPSSRPTASQPSSRGLLFTATTSLWELEAATRGAVCTTHAAWVYDASTRDVRPFITPFLFVPPPGGNNVELAGAWRDQVSTWANQAAGLLAPAQPHGSVAAPSVIPGTGVAFRAGAGSVVICEQPGTHSSSSSSVGIAPVASASPAAPAQQGGGAMPGASVPATLAPAPAANAPGSPRNFFQRFVARLAASVSSDATPPSAGVVAASAPASPVAVAAAATRSLTAPPQLTAPGVASAGAAEDSVDLSCPVCLDRFDRDARRPLVLPCCGNSVCAACWEDVAARALAAAPKPVKASKKGSPQPAPVTAQCPLDRAKVDISRPLVVNRALMQLLFRSS